MFHICKLKKILPCIFCFVLGLGIAFAVGTFMTDSDASGKAVGNDLNLMNSFREEAADSRLFLLFADLAKQENKMNVCRLFRAAAAADTVYGAGFYRLTGEGGSCDENIHAAEVTERKKAEELYPEMARIAEKEGDAEAKELFETASRAKTAQLALFSDLLSTSAEEEKHHYFVCPSCGCIAIDHAPSLCEVCGGPGAGFIRF